MIVHRDREYFFLPILAQSHIGPEFLLFQVASGVGWFQGFPGVERENSRRPKIYCNAEYIQSKSEGDTQF